MYSIQDHVFRTYASTSFTFFLRILWLQHPCYLAQFGSGRYPDCIHSKPAIKLTFVIQPSVSLPEFDLFRFPNSVPPIAPNIKPTVPRGCVRAVISTLLVPPVTHPNQTHILYLEAISRFSGEPAWQSSSRRPNSETSESFNEEA